LFWCATPSSSPQAWHFRGDSPPPPFEHVGRLDHRTSSKSPPPPALPFPYSPPFFPSDLASLQGSISRMKLGDNVRTPRHCSHVSRRFSHSGGPVLSGLRYRMSSFHLSRRFVLLHGFEVNPLLRFCRAAAATSVLLKNLRMIAYPLVSPSQKHFYHFDPFFLFLSVFFFLARCTPRDRTFILLSNLLKKP